MLVSSLYFWDNTHHTFHLPCGIMTLTLFEAKDTIGIDVSRAIYSSHIEYYHDKQYDEVSDQEHIVFLALWSCCCVSDSRSIQVAKKYIIIANQLHVGH